MCYLLRSDSYYINTKGWVGGCANGSLDDIAKISATFNFSSIIQLPTGQSTPLTLQTVAEKDQLRLVFNWSLKSGPKCQTETVSSP